MVEEYVCKVLTVESFDDGKQNGVNVGLVDKDQKIFNRMYAAPERVREEMLSISLAAITSGKLVVANFEKLDPNGQPLNLIMLGLLPRTA